MTSIFIDNRIVDLLRIQKSLAAEEIDPESKGVPHSPRHAACIESACHLLGRAMRELSSAKRLT